MAGPPVDRRQFLAAGGGGLLLCTLGGQQIRNDREADVEELAREIEVPPKVRAASASGAASAAPAVFTASGGKRREYWIKAEQRRWNIVPKGRDQMLGKKIKGKTKFNAFGYRAYTPGFASPIGKAKIPGPLIEAEVGDTIVVNFQNTLSSPVTIHPHGVQYSIEMDGAYKGKYTDPGGFVQQGETYQYVWEATPGTVGAGSTTTTGRSTRCPSTRACSGRSSSVRRAPPRRTRSSSSPSTRSSRSPPASTRPSGA